MAPNTFRCVFLLFALFSCTVLFNSAHGSSNSRQKFYVLSNRKGCVAVQSKTACPASKLRPDMAIEYHLAVRDAQMLFDHVEAANINNSECIAAFKTAYCKRTAPKCFDNGSVDFGDGRIACWKINTTCEDVVISDLEDFCQSIPVAGKHSLDECVLPSRRINGPCPQPEYKVSVMDLQ